MVMKCSCAVSVRHRLGSHPLSRAIDLLLVIASHTLLMPSPTPPNRRVSCYSCQRSLNLERYEASTQACASMTSFHARLLTGQGVTGRCSVTCAAVLWCPALYIV
jgi:hypothetical protein